MNKLRAWREQKGWSLSRTARHIKVGESTLVKYENDYEMRINIARKVSKATGISMSELNVKYELLEEMEKSRKANEENPIILDERTWENWWALLYVVENLNKPRWRRLLH